MDTINNDDEMMTNGVLFNEESKILLTEKFVNIEFLVPFPNFDLNMTKEIDNYLKKLDDLWMHHSVFCNMNFSTNFNSNDSTFNIQWLIQLHKETDLARQDEEKLREETKEFLNPATFTNAPRRTKRAAPLVALAVASIGLFGGGILVGNQGCGLKGIFGSCQEKAKENANIEGMTDFVDELSIDVHRLRAETNEKFFMVSKELRTAIRQAHDEFVKVQNENWRIVEEQFDIFSRNIHLLRDCTQLLFSRQQLNFNYDSVASQLQLAYTNIRTYRSALYAFKLNLMTAIPTLLRNQLPMSLLPKDSLFLILEEVAKIVLLAKV